MAIGEFWKRLVGAGKPPAVTVGPVQKPEFTRRPETPFGERSQPDDGAFDLTENLDKITATMPIAPPTPLAHSSFAYYTPHGAFDELVDPHGMVAAHWQPFLAGLGAMTHDQRLQRVDRINMRIRETGIAHDLFADPTRNLQPWRVDLVPLIVSAETWSRLESAVGQRARLMEALLSDLYGQQTAIREGLVPAGLIFSDPTYLRSCRYIEPKQSRIQFFAADLTRSENGEWQVVDVHVETPAGIGYALANRTIMTHVCGDLFNSSKAVRLAPFFRQLHDSVSQRTNRPDPSIALLTPGPRHPDYFSHSYLARYLGFLLVEGDDLRVDQNGVSLKTLEGLQRVDLIVRCVAGAASDALELDPTGFLGPVGLVQAMRARPDLIVNALGTAIAENRGLGPFLPALSNALLGERLEIRDIEKWWLGDREKRRLVLGDLDSYYIRRTFEKTDRPGRAAAARDAAQMSSSARAALAAEIELDGASFVAEKKSRLGTAPSYGPNHLEPKPFALRVFATATPQGFKVMPGGLAMTVNPGASMALAAPDGAARDVWVLSDAPPAQFTSLWRASTAAAEVQRVPRELPSRVADNLFWLGRYLEDADWIFRLLRSCLGRAEADGPQSQNFALMQSALNSLVEPTGSVTAMVPSAPDELSLMMQTIRTVMTSAMPQALPQTLANVHRIAGLSRDRLSNEAWRTLNAFYVARSWDPNAFPASIGDQLDLIDTGMSVIATFNGLSHENMNRNVGWSFLDMGRRIARALNVCRASTTTFATGGAGEDNNGSLLFALEVADSFMTYRSRYCLEPTTPLVLDLLILDETNPRSLAFQVAQLMQHMSALPPHHGAGRDSGELQRMVVAMQSEVRLADVLQLAWRDPSGRRPNLASLLENQSTRVLQLTDAVTRRYFNIVEKGPTWSVNRTRRD